MTVLFIISNPALAADSSTTAPTTTPATTATIAAATKSALPYIYAPDGCDFRINFPSAPLKGKRCDADALSHCNDVTTFTHVFALDATVDFTVTCNPAEQGMYEHYSGDVMRAALGGMVGKGKLDDFQTSFKQYDDAKQATLIGTGKQGVSDKIYIAQLWIGHKSVFTVEGQMLGQDNAEANDMYAAILKSIRYKDWKLAPPAPAAAQAQAAVPAVTPPPAATPAVVPDPAVPTMIKMGDPQTAPAFAPASTTLIVTPIDPVSGKPLPAK